MPASDGQKRPDEIYCHSCGERIKERAELCPHCGVRNDRSAGSTGASSAAHDPSQYTTSVSGTWWYGVAGGTALWVILLVLSGSTGGGGSFVGFLLLAAWIGLPLAAYFDMQYVRANGDWNPSTGLWVVLLAVWIVNVVAGGVYLYRRHEALGEP